MAFPPAIHVAGRRRGAWCAALLGVVLSLLGRSPSASAQPAPAPTVSPNEDPPTTAGIPAGASGAILTPPKPAETAPAAAPVTPPVLTHFEHAEYPKAAL